MKRTIKLSFALLFVAISISIAQAQLVPLTYTVTLTNANPLDTITGLDPNMSNPYNVIDFDIYIQQTNVPSNSTEIMRFALGQFYININMGTPGLTNTDTIGGYATLRYIPGSTTFTNLNALPTNPQFRLAAPTDTTYPFIAGVSRGGYTQLNSNAALGNTSDVQISNVFPGTKVGSYRLKKNVTAASPSPYFPYAIPYFTFRRAPALTGRPNPVTKIFAYNGLGGLSTEVTAKGTFVCDIDFNVVWPVELTGFTASANRNSVNLNWSTVSEINNSGFDVERSIVNSQKSNVWERISFLEGNGTITSPVNYSFTDKNLATGKYNYRLKQIDFNGNFEYFNLSNEIEVGVPAKFDLSQNYPNPFNPSTKINYDLPKDGQVSIALFDLTGRQVSSLVNEFKTAGYYTVQFNASNLSSGMYFYRFTADNFVSAKKMVLIK